jgi:hypothetical protein
MLLEGRRFRRVALCDAVAIAPWITPFSRHVQRHLEAFATVPEHIHRQMVAAHLRSAIAREISDAELDPGVAEQRRHAIQRLRTRGRTGD